MTPYQVVQELTQRFGPADGDGRWRAGPHVRLRVEERGGTTFVRVCCADERVAPSVRFTEIRSAEQLRALIAYMYDPEVVGAGELECAPASDRIEPPRPPQGRPVPQRRAG